MSEEIMAADSLLHELAALTAQRDRAHAATAALIEAVAACADFIESYTLDSHLAGLLPAFYVVFRVYGKNARAALAHARPQAEALLRELEAARAVVACWRRQPPYFDDCDPGQNDPYYAWTAEMIDRVVAYDEATKARTE